MSLKDTLLVHNVWGHGYSGTCGPSPLHVCYGRQRMKDDQSREVWGSEDVTLHHTYLLGLNHKHTKQTPKA